METLNISPERFQQALAWMNGQASTLGEQEVLQMLRSLTGRFQENCRTLRSGPVARFRNLRLAPHPLSLSSIISETEERVARETPEEAPAKAEDSPSLQELLEESVRQVSATEPKVVPQVAISPERAAMQHVAEENRLDSVKLINAIAHVAASAGYPLTQSKAQLILYCLYGSYLGAGEERLPIEHPQMWKYGPVFPRAFKKGAIEDRAVCEESYSELLEKEPCLAGALSGKTQSMMATPMADLNAVHKSDRSPYGRTKARFPEKWGTQIPDEEIAEYFRISDVMDTGQLLH